MRRSSLPRATKTPGWRWGSCGILSILLCMSSYGLGEPGWNEMGALTTIVFAPPLAPPPPLGPPRPLPPPLGAPRPRPPPLPPRSPNPPVGISDNSQSVKSIQSKATYDPMMLML